MLERRERERDNEDVELPMWKGTRSSHLPLGHAGMQCSENRCRNYLLVHDTTLLRHAIFYQLLRSAEYRESRSVRSATKGLTLSLRPTSTPACLTLRLWLCDLCHMLNIINWRQQLSHYKRLFLSVPHKFVPSTDRTRRKA